MRISQNKLRIYDNGKIYRVIMGSSGNSVTYHIDTNTSTTSFYNTGASVLDYTPTKSGWTFVGWREDNTASSSVLTSKTMGSSAMSLYAVFKKNVRLGYYDATDAYQYVDGTRYYNNGNENNPRFTMTQKAMSGWTALGWATEYTSHANTVVYNNGATITLTGNLTIYGRYSQAITLTYAGNGATGGSTASQTEWRHYNAPNRYGSATFTLASNGFTRTNYAFNGWNLGAAGATVSLSANTTAYAQWKINVADSTRNVSINLYKGQEQGWFDKNTVLATVATSIDTSLYSGAELTLTSADLWSEWTTTIGKIVLTDGTNEAQIAYSYLRYDGVEESHTRNLKPTITFSKSSGTVNLTIVAYATQNGGNCHYNVQGGTLRLIGRKG